MDWLVKHTDLLQVLVSVLMAIVWLIYLQLFLVSFLRQRRPEILISRGAGIGLESRCFIANLGLEPIYVSQLLMTVDVMGERLEAVITDRGAMTEEQMRDPLQATNQGPVKSGDHFDAGSFRELIHRALRQNDLEEETVIEGFELTVIAVHAASQSFIGATRRYDCVGRESYNEIVPRSLETIQLRRPLARWRLRQRLKRQLEWYRS